MLQVRQATMSLLKADRYHDRITSSYRARLGPFAVAPGVNPLGPLSEIHAHKMVRFHRPVRWDVNPKAPKALKRFKAHDSD